MCMYTCTKQRSDADTTSSHPVSLAEVNNLPSFMLAAPMAACGTAFLKEWLSGLGCAFAFPKKQGISTTGKPGWYLALAVCRQ